MPARLARRPQTPLPALPTPAHTCQARPPSRRAPVTRTGTDRQQERQTEGREGEEAGGRGGGGGGREAQSCGGWLAGRAGRPVGVGVLHAPTESQHPAMAVRGCKGGRLGTQTSAPEKPVVPHPSRCLARCLQNGGAAGRGGRRSEPKPGTDSGEESPGSRMPPPGLSQEGPVQTWTERGGCGVSRRPFAGPPGAGGTRVEPSRGPAPRVTHLGQRGPDEPATQLGGPVGKQHRQVEAPDERGCQGHRGVEVSAAAPQRWKEVMRPRPRAEEKRPDSPPGRPRSHARACPGRCRAPRCWTRGSTPQVARGSTGRSPLRPRGSQGPSWPFGGGRWVRRSPGP